MAEKRTFALKHHSILNPDSTGTNGAGICYSRVCSSFCRAKTFHVGEHCCLLGRRGPAVEFTHLVDEPAKRATLTSEQQLEAERGGLGQQGTLKHKRKGKILLENLSSQFSFPNMPGSALHLRLCRRVRTCLPVFSCQNSPACSGHSWLFSHLCAPVTAELCCCSSPVPSVEGCVCCV